MMNTVLDVSEADPIRVPLGEFILCRTQTTEEQKLSEQTGLQAMDTTNGSQNMSHA